MAPALRLGAHLSRTVSSLQGQDSWVLELPHQEALSPPMGRSSDLLHVQHWLFGTRSSLRRSSL